MDYCKLEKIDKIFISLLCIFVSFICVFNTFSFASENVDVQILENARINSSDVIAVGTSSIHNLYYISLEKGYKYNITVTNNTTSDLHIRSGYVDVVKIGETVSSVNSITFLDKYNVVVNADTVDNNFYVTFPYPANDITVTCERYPVQSMSNTIHTLVEDVGIDNFWGIFNNSIPFILVILIFSLGVWFIIHNIIEHSKGREY